MKTIFIYISFFVSIVTGIVVPIILSFFNLKTKNLKLEIETKLLGDYQKKEDMDELKKDIQGIQSSIEGIKNSVDNLKDSLLSKEEYKEFKVECKEHRQKLENLVERHHENN